MNVLPLYSILFKQDTAAAHLGRPEINLGLAEMKELCAKLGRDAQSTAVFLSHKENVVPT
jgi:hypothetical protein